MSVTVRIADPASDGDVRALAGLRFRWRHEEGGEAGDLESFTPAFGHWWREHADTHVAFLAEQGTSPVGMVWLGVWHRVPGPERFVRLAGMIQSAYVVPEARDAGVGAALVARAVETARERGLAYLGVHPSERSYPLYERSGFAETRAILELGLSEPRPQ